VLSGDVQLSLLILDPATPRDELARALAGGGWPRLVKRGLHTLRTAHYEIVSLDADDAGAWDGPRDTIPERLFSGL